MEAQDPNGPPVNYQQYLALLLSAAEGYDSSNAESGKLTGRDQQVFYSGSGDFDSDNNDASLGNQHDESYNVDTFLTHVTNRVPPIQSRKPRINVASSNNVKEYPFNIIPQESWLRIPADVRAELTALRRNNNNKVQNIHNTIIHNVDENSDYSESVSPGLDNNDTGPNDNDHFGNNLIDCSINKMSISDSNLQQVVDRNININRRTPNNTNRKLDSSSSSESNQSLISVNGTYYRKCNFTCIEYRVHNNNINVSGYSLVDRGANGGLLGSDVRVLERSDRRITITGIDNHQVTDLPLCTAAGYGITNRGPVIFILHQYALLGHGKTIHSAAQLESFKIIVDDKSRLLGGKQRLFTPDGYLIPLDFIGGLPYFKLRPPTDNELRDLPHVVLTSDVDWDPTIVDNSIDPSNSDWYNESELCDNYGYHPFNDHGNLHTNVNQLTLFCNPNHEIHPQQLIYHTNWNINARITQPTKVNFRQMQPKFGWCSEEIIEKTFNNTTQYARSLNLYGDMRKHFKSRFPAFNVIRRNEPVATDTIISNTPAIGCGSKCAQIFVGRDSLVTDVYGMKTDQEFVSTLEDNIRRRGAMDKLISDRALSEISNKIKDILRALFIDDWQSEPHHQHQNFAERHYATIKSRTNIIMNRTGAPASTWLLCLKYVCFIFNRMSSKSLEWKTPLQVLTGETSDISIILVFTFWEQVYFSRVNTKFPSESTEELGRFVGFGETVGDAMTFLVYCTNTKRILYRSNVRSADDPKRPNHRLSSDGELVSTVDDKPTIDKIFIQSKSDDLAPLHEHRLANMPGYSPYDLINRSFLDLPCEDGQRFRLRVIKVIADNIESLDKDPHKIKFLAESKDGGYDKIIGCNEILSYLDEDNISSEDMNKFRDITAHQGPLTSRDPNYKGSKFNVLIEWEDGDTTYEPLDVIAADDPVTCAIYAKRNNLLNTPGWRRFKRIARENSELIATIHKTITSFHQRPIKYKYGFQVPNNHMDVVMLDKAAGNTLWQESERTEIQALNDYDTFIDLGKGNFPSSEYKRIRCHMVYDVKHDGRHKSRLVAGGHLTPVPDDSTYSGVISLRALRLIVFLSELNNLELWGADVSSAYLEAKTNEKVYFVAGDEFGDKRGHTMVINKALYGLRTSGLRWHEKFADILRDIGFYQSKGEPDIWMRSNGETYEYIGVYVDDLAIAAIHPEEIIKILQQQHGLKLKGVGPMKFHLGCDFQRDFDGKLSFGPKSYINKMLDNYERLFGEKPKEYITPLEKNDHPELDDSEFLDQAGINIYQSLIGAAQWAVSLGSFDIQTAIMSNRIFA